MKKRSFIKLNSILGLVFLIALGVILIVVNPFEANIFLFIIFYLVFFALLLSVLNLISIYIKIPFWLRTLIVIAIIFILIVQSARV